MKNLVPLILAAAATTAHASENVLTLGGGLAAGPRYAGSKETRAAPVIAIDYQMSNGFYASTMRGLGFGTELGGFSLDAALGVRGERKEKNDSGLTGSRGSAELRGMGDIKASATTELHASYDLAPGLMLGASMSLPLSRRENGKTAGLQMNGLLHQAGRDRVGISAGIHFGDVDYMQTFHGVSAAQAARTGLKPFNPRGGLYQATIRINWDHRVDERWAVTGMLGANTLLRNAADSPLTHRKTAPTAMFYASYRY